MRLTLFLCAALSWVSVPSFSTAEMARFPSRVSQVPSPDRKFVLVNTDRDQEPNHFLSLQDKVRGGTLPLLSYRRHVDVSWSKDSRFLFVNDYAESDLADCVLIRVGDSVPEQARMSSLLRQEIHDFMRSFRGSHLYVTCVSWKGDDHILVSIAGDGSSRHRFIFDATTRKVMPAHCRGHAC